MKIKLRHDKDVVCPYKEDKTCKHPRCIRMRLQECVYYHMNEQLIHAQITIKIINHDERAKNKYLRRVNYGKN